MQKTDEFLGFGRKFPTLCMVQIFKIEQNNNNNTNKSKQKEVRGEMKERVKQDRKKDV